MLPINIKYDIMVPLAKANIRNSITLGGCVMKKQIEIPNTANVEKYVSQMLQEMDGERRLIDVTLSDKGYLQFMYLCETSKSAKSFVKMFSKEDKELKDGTIRKGYKYLYEIMERAFNKKQLERLCNEGFVLVKVIETDKHWMLFWSKA